MGLIEWIETKYEGSQGHLWHVLIYAASEQKGLDISSLYIEPEGDVFVAYAPDDRVLIHVASVISELISHKTLMLKTAEYAEEKNLWNKFHCARR
ncbi:hypothetical protein [Marinobacter sp.]|uniref:hypothetical protein n=1 Tax=Marinobacter sp. TaxID=50741 RepID=UPI003A94A22C